MTDFKLINDQIKAQRAYFDTDKTKEIKHRISMLKKLRSWIKKNETKIQDAVYADIKKPLGETYLFEIGPSVTELNNIIRHVKTWSGKRYVATPVYLHPSRSYIIPEPKGQVMIFAPWNYPFQLLVMPLMAAIAAGNVAVVKPAHETSNTSQLINKMIQDCFDPLDVICVQGPGAEIGDYLLDNFRFDHIFFTGSTKVGRQIMEKAAKHLTPVTLELGGKSPAIIQKGFDLDFSAKKIVWGKFINCGQTCVAPDYILVHKSDAEALIKKLSIYIESLFGKDIKSSSDYGRIVSASSFERLESYMKDGVIEYKGENDKSTLFFHPTIMKLENLDSSIMQSEIFGPILPVITYEHEDDIIKIVRRNRYPLSTYIFSDNAAFYDKIVNKLSFGSGCINNVIQQLGNSNLPFGGVQSSGMGAYHGQAGFDTFSHLKSVLHSSKYFDFKLKYQPYTVAKMNLFRKLFNSI
jgi:aldehyde dehydrogenase (NAD+)